jgi:hypothetical protein
LHIIIALLLFSSLLWYLLMTMMRMMNSLLLVSLLQGFILSGFHSPTGAFQVSAGYTGIGGRLYTLDPRSTRQGDEGSVECLMFYSALASSSRPSTTALFVGKQDKKPTDSKVDPSTEIDGFRMFLAYATPWRNPNSIFVYLFLIIFLLGKYSEAKSAAGGAL